MSEAKSKAPSGAQKRARAAGRHGGPLVRPSLTIDEAESLRAIVQAHKASFRPEQGALLPMDESDDGGPLDFWGRIEAAITKVLPPEAS